MKRILAFAFICFLFLTTTNAYADTYNYSNDEICVSFSIPSGWEKYPFIDDSNPFQTRYSPANKKGRTIIYFTGLDYWTLVDNSLPRNETNFSILDDDLVKSLLLPLEANSMKIKRFGGNQFYVITCPVESYSNGISTTYESEIVFTLFNGYILMFEYMTVDNFTVYLSSFENMLKTIQISFPLREQYTTDRGVQFGMTPQEVQNIETNYNNVLKGTFEDSNSFQLYYENKMYAVKGEVRLHSIQHSWTGSSVAGRASRLCEPITGP